MNVHFTSFDHKFSGLVHVDSIVRERTMRLAVGTYTCIIGVNGKRILTSHKCFLVLKILYSY